MLGTAVGRVSCKADFLCTVKISKRFACAKSLFYCFVRFKVARYSFSGSTTAKFEPKLRRHKQRFGKVANTVVLDKDENLL